MCIPPTGDLGKESREISPGNLQSCQVRQDGNSVKDIHQPAPKTPIDPIWAGQKDGDHGVMQRLRETQCRLAGSAMGSLLESRETVCQASILKEIGIPAQKNPTQDLLHWADRPFPVMS